LEESSAVFIRVEMIIRASYLHKDTGQCFTNQLILFHIFRALEFQITRKRIDLINTTSFDGYSLFPVLTNNNSFIPELQDILLFDTI